MNRTWKLLPHFGLRVRRASLSAGVANICQAAVHAAFDKLVAGIGSFQLASAARGLGVSAVRLRGKLYYRLLQLNTIGECSSSYITQC